MIIQQKKTISNKIFDDKSKKVCYYIKDNFFGCEFNWIISIMKMSLQKCSHSLMNKNLYL